MIVAGGCPSAGAKLHPAEQAPRSLPVEFPPRQPKRVRRVLELIVGAVLFMVINRHQLRALYLAPARATELVVVSPQWGVFLLFLVSFVLCVGLTIYAVARAVKDRPA